MTQNLPIAPRAPRTFDGPSQALPPGSCDGHVHMVSDGRDYALYSRRVETPAEGDFDLWFQDCTKALDHMGFDRVVFVHSILHGADNQITLDATTRFGPTHARAVVLVEDGTGTDQLTTLRDAGAAAVRLNYVHGGILSWKGAVSMAPELASVGMHIQMLLNSRDHMAQIADDIRALPVPVVIDHLGWPDVAAGVNEAGFQLLSELLAEGHVYVKLSALYRYDDAPFDRASTFVRKLVDANPERCLWGSDWPHLMLGDAQMPNTGGLLNRLIGDVSSDELHRILVENSERLYGFDPAQRKRP